MEKLTKLKDAIKKKVEGAEREGYTPKLDVLNDSGIKGELSGMLQLASDLYFGNCIGLKTLISYNSFDGLTARHVGSCSCAFGPVEEGSGQFDLFPRYLRLYSVCFLKSVSDFSIFWV
ncbi:hypothetical protein CQW23_16867 [Capsicum baccatum]|uniref:Uncharacterized protein n=1 Tax=Capsicum baccatum TaxID=33114 RepID=A0A2G2WCB8_CAPBA|nr:hypothetical protein CQW23_16867 [Capsicum baccatum]